jgi:nicotinate phosphoribosyltransferase
MVYKLVAYAGRGRMKLSTRKVLLPERKQVFREEADGNTRGDVLARHDEVLPGRPLLSRMMHGGRRLEGTSPTLEAIRTHAREEVARLPARVRALPRAEPPYPVDVSPTLSEARERLAKELSRAMEVAR